MAIEAIYQVASTASTDKPSIFLRHLHHLHIIKVFQLSADDDDVGSEVFTFMHAAKPSGTTVATNCYNFEISSYGRGKRPSTRPAPSV